MADYAVPKSGVAYIFYVELPSQANTLVFQANPTIAAGDFKVSTDGAAFANLATLPVVTPSGGKSVKISLSSGEMTGDNIKIVASDAAGAEWCDQSWLIQTAPRGIGDLAFPVTSGRGLAVDSSNRVDLGLWLGSAPSALQSGRVETIVGAVTAGVIAAASFAANALDAVWSTTARTITGGTIGTYTGNTPQTGDAFARIGTAGVGLTNLGDTRIANLDATVSSRTKPADTQAAVTLVTTTTNLTNAPTAGDLTAAMKASVQTADDAAMTANALLNLIATYIDTEVAAIKAKTDNLPASPAAVGSAMTLTGGERNSIAAALLDLTDAIVTGVTVRKALRLIAASQGGKTSGGGTATFKIRDLLDTKDLVIATVDADGDRSVVTLDLT